ncbi:MAG: hypothetical protein E7633_08935 [Ruminococcaceae bacterium]|nr:hypothetical protein [Oscillospiraceae bacterium]
MRKNLTNKVIALLMLFTMIFATVSTILPVYAAGTTITVADVTGNPGKEITVDVTISGNTGFGSGTFTLEYDSKVLTLKAIDVKGKVLAGATVNVAKNKISFAKAANVTKDGVLFTATFEINKDAPEGVSVISVDAKNIMNATTHELLSITNKKGSVNVKVPHVCGKAEYVKEVDSSCSKEGTKAHYLCSCGKKYSDEACTKEMSTKDLTIAKKNHNYGSWKTTKEPTCTAKGKKERTCKDCNYVATSSISANGHKWGEWEVTTPATATVNGVETRKCSECNEKETREIIATGHTFGEWVETKAPTCTAKGEQTRTCTDPGCDEKETREIAALDHNYGEWTVSKPATCCDLGEESRTCSICQGVEKRDIAKDPDNHVYGEWTVSKEASCGVKGEETRTCACGAKETRETEALTHEWEWVVDKEATKSKDGVKHEECKHCGEKRNEGTVIEKTGNGMLVFWIILIVVLIVGAGVVVFAFIYKRKRAGAKG